MDHTHTFEIETADIEKVEGEVSFNGSKPPHISFSTSMEMEIADLKKLTGLMEYLTNFYKCCGQIVTLEVNKKV